MKTLVRCISVLLLLAGCASHKHLPETHCVPIKPNVSSGNSLEYKSVNVDQHDYVLVYSHDPSGATSVMRVHSPNCSCSFVDNGQSTSDANLFRRHVTEFVQDSIDSASACSYTEEYFYSIGHTYVKIHMEDCQRKGTFVIHDPHCVCKIGRQ